MTCPLDSTAADDWLRFAHDKLRAGRFKSAQLGFLKARSMAKDSGLTSEAELGLISACKHTEFGPVCRAFEVEEIEQDGIDDRILLDYSLFDFPLPRDLDTSNFAIAQNEPVSVFRPCREWYTLPKFFRWIVPNKLAGMARPRSAEDVVALSQPPLSIDAIITLTEEAPLPSEWFTGTPCKNFFMPVVDYTPPSQEQIKEFFNILKHHERVLVHCMGGKGRTGVILASYLGEFGLPGFEKFDGPDAIRRLRVMRPLSVETADQEKAVCDFLCLENGEK